MLDATCLDVSEVVFLDGDDLQVEILFFITGKMLRKLVPKNNSQPLFVKLKTLKSMSWITIIHV